MICAAEFATQENINFMATLCKGAHLYSDERRTCRKTWICPPMVTENTDNHETAFTVSIDHIDTTTGISAAERALYNEEMCG